MDLGCGDGKLATHFFRKAKQDKKTKRRYHILKDIKSFDLVANKPFIKACDISKLTEKDNTADLTVFCLSLMGTNYSSFIKEALRVLKKNGILLIAEVSSRLVDLDGFIKKLNQYGAGLESKRDMQGYFYLLTFSKKTEDWCNISNTDEEWTKLLKPCIYKKR